MEDKRTEIPVETTEEMSATQNFEIVDAGVTLEVTKELHRYIHRSNIKAGFIWGSLLLVTAVILCFVYASVIVPFFVGAIVMFAMGIASLRVASKNACKSYEDSKNKTEVWHIYDDHLEYRVTCDGAEELTLRIHTDKITDVEVLKNIYVFKYEKVVLGVPKGRVAEESTFFRILFPSGEAKSAQPRRGALETLYRIFTTASILYMVIVVSAVGVNVSAWWISLLGILFPIAAFLVWGIARGKGIKIKGSVFTNIMIVVSLVLYLLYACVMLASAALDSLDTYWDTYYEENTSPTVSAALAACELDILAEKRTYCNTYKTFDDHAHRYVQVTNTEFYLTEADVNVFCSIVENENRWVTQLEGETREFFLAYVDYCAGDVFFTYNLTEGTYNALPMGEGACDYLIVIFSAQYNYMDIYEFTK